MKKLFDANSLNQWLEKIKLLVKRRNDDDDYFDHPFAIF